MCKGQKLRALVNERLTAAAAEIFELFERTIAEYEQEVLLLTQRNHKQLQQLERAGVQIVSASQKEVGPSLEPPHIKEEEPELCIKQEEEQLQVFTPVCVKTEDDEDKSSVLHQRATEENREETNGEDCGAEAGCSSDPLTQLHSDSEEHTDSSSDTDHSEDYSQEQAPSKRSYAMISPDSFVTDVGGTHRPYSCSECGKTFFRKDNLHNHMIVHTEERPHKCSVCEKSFKRKSNLKKHLKVRHHICPVCKKGFVQNTDLLLHMRTHTEDGTSMTNPDSSPDSKPYRCSECGKAFRCNTELLRHMLVHTAERPHKNAVCEKMFKEEGHLINHLRVQHYVSPVHEKDSVKNCNVNDRLGTQVEDGALNPDSSVTDVGGNSKKHRCSVCGKRFRCNADLRRHVLVHTGERPFKCSVCEKGFKEKCLLKKHMYSHTGEKPFKCPLCHKGFTERSHVKTHMFCHTGENPFRCSVCEQAFKKKSYLKTHMYNHKGDKRFQCPLCHKGFAFKYQVKTHMNIHTGERPFRCSICNQSFTRKNYLNVHMIQHTGVKPYVCSVCEKGFIKKESLRKHMRTHPEDSAPAQTTQKTSSTMINLDSPVNDVEGTIKPYRCSECGKEFEKCSDLQSHELIHTGERPYKCSVCEKCFRWERGLKDFVTVHTDKPFSCSVCQNVLSRKVVLKTL